MMIKPTAPVSNQRSKGVFISAANSIIVNLYAQNHLISR